MAKVLIPTPLRQFTGKQDSITVSGGTVGEVLASADPGFSPGELVLAVASFWSAVASSSWALTPGARARKVCFGSRRASAARTNACAEAGTCPSERGPGLVAISFSARGFIQR